MRKLLEQRVWWLIITICVSLLTSFITSSLYFTIATTIVYIYYIYRLFYLYRGTDKRGLWTAFTLIGFACTFVISHFLSNPPDMVLLGGQLLLLACWIHDIILVFQDLNRKRQERKEKEGEEKKHAFDPEGLLIALLFLIPLILFAAMIVNMIRFIAPNYDENVKVLNEIHSHQIFTDEIPVHLADLGLTLEGTESCEATAGAGSGNTPIESMNYKTFYVLEDSWEVIEELEYSVYTAKTSTAINTYMKQKEKSDPGVELSEEICSTWHANRGTRIDDCLFLVYDEAIPQWDYKDTLSDEQVQTVLSALHGTYEQIPAGN